MHRLVADLPALFRCGRLPVDGDADVGTDGLELPAHLPRLPGDLKELCVEGIESLELVVSQLTPGKRLNLPSPTIRSGGPGPPVRPVSELSAVSQGQRQRFLREVPDEGLELSSLWSSVASWASETDETELRNLALLAFSRRLQTVHLVLRRSVSSISLKAADVAVLKPSMKAEIQMCKDLLSALCAGSAGACTVAATAQAARDAAELRRSAAVCAATALLARRSRGAAPATPVLAPVAPVEPPNSTVEGIQRWIHSVRETASVAASGSENDWKRQKEVLRAGLTGTAVCLGSGEAKAAPSPWLSPTGSLKVTSERECAICLELLPLGALPEKVIPLPCGHTFHSACASQWLQKCPRCPVCRHSPFLPLEVKKTPLA